MTRPRTKAPPVAVRLSLAAMERAESRAAQAGVPVRRWLERQLERALVTPPRPEVEGAKSRHPTTKGVEVATEIENRPARVKAALDAAGAFAPGEPRPRPVLVADEGACAHGRYDVIAGGMRRCKDCPAVMGVGGVWRVPR